MLFFLSNRMVMGHPWLLLVAALFFFLLLRGTHRGYRWACKRSEGGDKPAVKPGAKVGGMVQHLMSGIHVKAVPIGKMHWSPEGSDGQNGHGKTSEKRSQIW